MLKGTSASHPLLLRFMDRCGRKGRSILRPRRGRCLQQNSVCLTGYPSYISVPTAIGNASRKLAQKSSQPKISQLGWRRSSLSPSLSCEAIHKWLLLKERGSFLSGCSPWKSTPAPLCVSIFMYIEAAPGGLYCVEIIKFIPASSVTPTKGSCRGQF